MQKPKREFNPNDSPLKPLVKVIDILKIASGHQFQATFEDMERRMQELNISEEELNKRTEGWKREIPFCRSERGSAIIGCVHPLGLEKLLILYAGGFELEKAEISGHRYYADCVDDVTARAKHDFNGILKTMENMIQNG